MIKLNKFLTHEEQAHLLGELFGFTVDRLQFEPIHFTVRVETLLKSVAKLMGYTTYYMNIAHA